MLFKIALLVVVSDESKSNVAETFIRTRSRLSAPSVVEDFVKRGR